MPDLTMSVELTRDLLGLGPLNINDRLRYRCAPQFLGATRSWNRNQVTGPYIDGAVTVDRSLQMVQEQIAVEIFGRTSLHPSPDPNLLQANLAELIAAFDQDAFSMTIDIDGAIYAYAMESADVVVAWTPPRMVARQVQAVFTVPRQPVPLAGGV